MGEVRRQQPDQAVARLDRTLAVEGYRVSKKSASACHALGCGIRQCIATSPNRLNADRTYGGLISGPPSKPRTSAATKRPTGRAGH